MSLRYKWMLFVLKTSSRLLRSLSCSTSSAKSSTYLAVSRPTFERDWDIHFSRFEQTRTNIERKSYDKWKAHIRARYKQGREKLRNRRLQVSTSSKSEISDTIHQRRWDSFTLAEVRLRWAGTSPRFSTANAGAIGV